MAIITVSTNNASIGEHDTNTIYRIDTIRVTDTVFIEKEKPKKEAQPKIKDIPVDFFQPGIEYNC